MTPVTQFRFMSLSTPKGDGFWYRCLTVYMTPVTEFQFMSLSTPKGDGFRAPAEWEPHSACLIGWPWRKDVWPGKAVRAQRAFLSVIQAICKSEKVIIIANPGTFTETHSRELATDVSERQVEVRFLACDDAWLRDMGPTFVIDQDRREVRGVDWTFNAYGDHELVEKREKDIAFARAFCDAEQYKVYSSDLVCEGGGLAFDGEGTVITTEAVLLDENRNGKVKTKEEVESILLSYLGADKVIWLPEGVCGDAYTKGHIDNLVAFVKPGEVVLNWTGEDSDPQYPVSVRAEQLLKNATDARGRKFTVHRLHQPESIRETEEEAQECAWHAVREGERLPASYVNFYIANKAVVVPQFNQPKWDDEAARKLQSLFPEREIIGVQSRDILIGGGSIHCITQQVPLCAEQ